MCVFVGASSSPSVCQSPAVGGCCEAVLCVPSYELRHYTQSPAVGTCIYMYMFLNER